MAIIQSGADATQLTIDTNSQAARGTLYDVNGNVLVGQKPMAASLPVVLASDQEPLPISVSGTLPVSATALPLPAGAATETTLSAASAKLPATLGQKPMATSLAVASDQEPLPVSDDGGSLTVDGSVSLGTATGKTIVGNPGTLTTTNTTANQVVSTYTVTAGKTLYLQEWSWSVRLGTMAATATNFGLISLETPSGTKINTDNLASGNGAVAPVIHAGPSEPMPIAAGTVIRIVVTPAANTNMVWTANLVGYEK